MPLHYDILCVPTCVWVLEVVWPGNVRLEHIKPITTPLQPLQCSPVFADCWFEDPTSVHHFHYLDPVEGELAPLQLLSQVQHLRDTVGRGTISITTEIGTQHAIVNYLEKSWFSLHATHC